MPIRAVVFDIGAVLEFSQRTGWEGLWEEGLGVQPQEIVFLIQ